MFKLTKNLYLILFLVIFEFGLIRAVVAETKNDGFISNKFNFGNNIDFPITHGEWKFFRKTELKRPTSTMSFDRIYLLNVDEKSPNALIAVTKSNRTSTNWPNPECENLIKAETIHYTLHGTTPSQLTNKCSGFYFFPSFQELIKNNVSGLGDLSIVNEALLPFSFNGSSQIGVSIFVLSKTNGFKYTFASYFLYPNNGDLNKEQLFKNGSSEYKAIKEWHEEYMVSLEESVLNNKFKSFAQYDKTSTIQKFFASKAKDSFTTQERFQVETNKPQRERLAQESNLASHTSPTSAAAMWLPVFNLPRCEGSDVTNWNGCIGVTYQQGKPYTGQFRNGSPYGQFEILANSETQTVQVNKLSQLELTQLNAQEKQRLENEKLREEATVAKQRQQELEEQLRQAQEARNKEQDRILAEQKATEQKRLFEESRVKEQQRLALEASEVSRLRAEAEDSKRIQAQLEEQLRVARLQNQLASPSAMTTMANRKALVIGNDTYKSVAKLLNAREDAKAIASNLTAVGYKVTLQLDLNEKEMKAALRTFSSQVQGGDEVMFFFAGHGVQLGATNYLLPTDIGGESEAQVKDEGIQLQRILDDMTEKKAKFTLAMIDACRDNPFKSMGRNIGGRGLAPTTAATGQMVVFSAGSGQQALDRLGSTDKNKNGVFTRTFLKEMQKSGVSIDRIIKNVRNEVAELAKTIGHEQVPAIYDQVLGDFYFKK